MFCKYWFGNYVIANKGFYRFAFSGQIGQFPVNVLSPVMEGKKNKEDSAASRGTIQHCQVSTSGLLDMQL